MAENLFHGINDGMGDGIENKADVRNLAVWRRLNEFKSDISHEKKSIEGEALRVEAQIARLRESKQWLTDMSIKLNSMSMVGEGDALE